MKSEAKDFIKQNQNLIRAIKEQENKVSMQRKTKMTAPTWYKYMELAKKLEIIEKTKTTYYLRSDLGNFLGMYIYDNNIEFTLFDFNFKEIHVNVNRKRIWNKTQGSIKRAISNIFAELKEQGFDFCYAGIAIDKIVKEGGNEVGLHEDNYPMFSCEAILSKKDCVFVNSNIPKLILEKLNRKSYSSTLPAKENIVYYNIKQNYFSIVESNRIVEKKDEFFGLLPMWEERPIRTVIEKLYFLEGEEYDNYYQLVKEQLFEYLKFNIMALVYARKPQLICISDEILKPKYIQQSSVYADIEEMVYDELTTGLFRIPIYIKEISVEDILVGAAIYAQYKYFDWELLID